MQEYDRADTGAIDVRKACVLKEGIAPTGNAFKVVWRQTDNIAFTTSWVSVISSHHH